MQWQEQPLEPSNDVLIRKAQPQDEDLEVSLDMLAFKMTKEDARAHYDRIKDNPGEQYYMIEADGETIGKIRVSRENSEAWIYGFAIFPKSKVKGLAEKRYNPF